MDLRNRAFLFVAYNTLLRMSEMSLIRVRDLEIMGDTVYHIPKKQPPPVNDWLEVSGLAAHPDAAGA